MDVPWSDHRGSPFGRQPTRTGTTNGTGMWDSTWEIVRRHRVPSDQPFGKRMGMLCSNSLEEKFASKSLNHPSQRTWHTAFLCSLRTCRPAGLSAPIVSSNVPFILALRPCKSDYLGPNSGGDLETEHPPKLTSIGLISYTEVNRSTLSLDSTHKFLSTFTL